MCALLGHAGGRGHCLRLRPGIKARNLANADFTVIVVILLNMAMFGTITSDHRPHFKQVFAAC